MSPKAKENETADKIERMTVSELVMELRTAEGDAYEAIEDEILARLEKTKAVLKKVARASEEWERVL